MVRRLAFMSAFALVLSVFASVAFAQQGNCTFAGGRTTCVETTTTTITRERTFNQQCQVGNSGRQGTQEVMVTEEATETTTTTTVFRGQSSNIVSGPTTNTQTSEFEETSRTEGQCKNNPGRQR
jgi:hypothetical protein